MGAYEDKTATLSDADNVWTEVRHMHMREAIDKLMADFNKFLEENAVFKGCVKLCGVLFCMLIPICISDNAANLNDMKEMLANLPQFQEQREKVSSSDTLTICTNIYTGQFSLHLSMAQECMGIFERDKLPLVANVEQVKGLNIILSTGH